MSVEQNKKTARAFYEAINAKDYDACARMASSDFVYIPQLGSKLQGIDKFVAMERANMDPFGDFKMEVKFLAGDGDRVAVYLTFDGVLQEGDTWHGVKVGNKHMQMDFMTWLHFNEEGKIDEKRAKYDTYFILKRMQAKGLPVLK
ncbi:MAG: ester cyclase [Selenomonas sp.]|jgi:predicted ester cyclase|nr:ester cyclase [Selenomonas sp.]MCI7331306.1 ester cyclase [Selenomonadaceae bacterium]MDY3916219.1 ester cyclase [Selenomonadaceae bacterium]